MLYTLTLAVNFTGLALAVWLGIYIVSRSPRSAIPWLTSLTLWSVAGFLLNFILAINPPPSPAMLPFWMAPLLLFWPPGAFENGWGNWLQGWQITPAVMFWHHLTLQLRPGGMNRWRWTRALVGYAIAIAAIIGQRYTPYVFTTVKGDPLYLTTLVPGPLYPYYMTTLFIFIVLSLVNLIRSARAASTLPQKRQLNLMVTATVVAGLVAPIGFVSYWLTIPLPRVSNSILMVLAIFLLGYAVTRYNAVVEGRVIPRDFVYNGVVILLVASLYFAVVWTSVVAYEVPAAVFSILVILAIITHSFVDVGRRGFDLIFYNRETRELRDSFRKLARRAYGTDALEETLSAGLETLCLFVHASYGLILLFKDGRVHPAASHPRRRFLPNLMPEALNSDDLVHLQANELPPPLQGAALLIPLYGRDNQEGALILGRPEEASQYEESEIERLLDAGDHISELIRESRREDEHLARLSQLAQTPLHALDMNNAMPSKTVEDGLRNLFDYAYLADSPLAKLKQMEQFDGNGVVTHLDRGKCVYQILLLALEKLRPPGEVPCEPIPRQWYPYLILHDAYMENKSNNEIMMRLYISEGTFNRTRRAAIRSVARVVMEMEAIAA
ncbi:MAG: hypothetical protein ACM3QS_07340 [Bacteroidota bacterium]